ncbi:type II toxin-antitoxin system mRNA interferase toxin, HP0892 family [Helicobacter pylori]
MIETSKKFDKDLKILVKNGFDLKLLYKVVGKFSQRATPSSPIQRPPTQRRFIKDFRECPLKPDLLLVYQIKKPKNTLFLVRLGSHSELF